MLTLVSYSFIGMISQKQKDIIVQKLAPYHPDEIGVFGSYARGENQRDSDLDLLVSFSNSPSLFDIIEIEDSLSLALGIKIDLVTKKSLHAKILPYVEAEVQIIHG